MFATNFKENLQKELPTNAPYICPIEECGYSGEKNKLSLIKHYGGSHRIVLKYTQGQKVGCYVPKKKKSKRKMPKKKPQKQNTSQVDSSCTFQGFSGKSRNLIKRSLNILKDVDINVNEDFNKAKKIKSDDDETRVKNEVKCRSSQPTGGPRCLLLGWPRPSSLTPSSSASRSRGGL